MLSRTLVLNNGVEIPRIGLGTFQASGAEVKTAVKAAVAQHGITHIDTAGLPGHEHAMGPAASTKLPCSLCMPACNSCHTWAVCVWARLLNAS